VPTDLVGHRQRLPGPTVRSWRRCSITCGLMAPSDIETPGIPHGGSVGKVSVSRSLVGGEQVQGAFAVGVVGLGVGAEGVQAGVPEEVGDQDRVGPAAEELGGEGVSQGVGSEAAPGGGVRAESDVVAEVGDDGARGPVGEPAAAAVEQQRRRVLRVRPLGRWSSQLVRAVRSSGRVSGSSRSLPPSRPLPRTRRLPLRAERATSVTSRPTTSPMRSPA